MAVTMSYMEPRVRLDIDALGNRVKLRRMELRLEQEQVGEAAGMSRAYVSRLENGSVKNPKVTDLASIAAALKVSLDTLIYGKPTGDIERDLPNLLRRRLGPDLGGAVARLDMAMAALQQDDISAATIVLESISERRLRRVAEQQAPYDTESNN